MIRSWCLLFLFFTSWGWSQDWQPSWEEALDKAQNKEQAILLVFSGSDWCIPCIRLDNNVWKSSDFDNYTRNRFVLYRADFPKRKKNKLSQQIQETHNRLAEKYNKNGYFPWVAILNAQLELLGNLSYNNETAVDFIQLIERELNE